MTVTESAPPEDDFELPIAGFKGTPEEIERQWFEKVYKGRGDSMLQLTWRAVIMGSILGCVLSLTNLYIGLKAGWGFGVAITACILSYAFWTTLYRFGIVGSEMSILENNCMQSTASSAGYSTGGTLISAFAAYMILHPSPEDAMSIPMMLGWVFFIAVLGVTLAIPMKRQMVNIDQLRFPSGIAAAETLKALHSHGDRGMQAAKALGIAGAVAAAIQFWADGLTLIGEKTKNLTNELFVLAGKTASQCSLSTITDKVNDFVLGNEWVQRTVYFEFDPMFLAAGALTGLRASASMLLGGTLCWAVFVPILQGRGYIEGTGYKVIILWTVWGGAACMITSSLVSIAFQWESMLRAFKSLGQVFSRKSSGRSAEMDAIEVPTSWFIAGQLFALIGLAILAKFSFGMPYWQSTVAVLLTFFLSLVACRITGETDTTPIGAMGKITQLVFAVLAPASTKVNLMSANITAGAAAASADLLTDLKSGYLLGANPRKQFIAQFAGIFSGTLVSVFCFRLLVPDASVLGDKFKAPAAMAWMAVAKLLSEGIDKLGPIRTWSIVIGGLVGVALPLLAKLFPKHEKWIPSAAGVGLAWAFPWNNAFSFFLGALIGYAWQKKAAKHFAEYMFPIASGVIAGASLMGVVLKFWENGPELIKQFSQGLTQFLHRWF
jgi:OPT family oligopeptide transporter